MTEPERLFHGSDSPLARAMLGAARAEAPSDRLLERTLLAVSAGAVVVGTASTVAGAVGTTSLSAVAAKWFGVGAVGGLLAMGAALGVEHALSPPAEVVVTTPAHPVPRVDVTRATPGPAKPEIEAPAPEVPKPAVAALPSVSTPKPASTEPSIARELQEIDAARSALSSGDPAKALALLDAYERQPGTKAMFQEALAIRMEAQAKSGNAAGARGSAERLLVMSPNGPHAARARQILSR